MHISSTDNTDITSVSWDGRMESANVWYHLMGNVTRIVEFIDAIVVNARPALVTVDNSII
jgi:hypothetical protein